MMIFRLIFNDDAKEQFQKLESSKGKQSTFKAICKTLALMETNLRHPSLHTHEYSSLEGPDSEKVFESYAQNKTPGAYRIFWYYNHEKNDITIISILPHL
jgi:hypothetical protein